MKAHERVADIGHVVLVGVDGTPARRYKPRSRSGVSVVSPKNTDCHAAWRRTASDGLPVAAYSPSTVARASAM
jgi:hypothetical protein